jgi:hypothetical protein
VPNLDTAESAQRLTAHQVENVDPGMWKYEVSGKQILLQWFSYRKANRERPLIGDKRPPSPLGDIQPDHWLAEYTTELLNVLHVLGLLVDLEPTQAQLLDDICAGPLIGEEDLHHALVVAASEKTKKKKKKKGPGRAGRIRLCPF